MESLVVFVALLGIIGALSVIYLVSSGPTSYGSLNLAISTNTTAIASNGSIGFEVALTNELDYSIYVPVENNWPDITGLGYPGNFYACGGATIYPMQIAMFKGDYSLANISSAGPPLDLTNTPNEGVVSLCPIFFPRTYLGYIFAPLSDGAKVVTDIPYSGTLGSNVTYHTGVEEAVYNISASYGFNAIGYWIGSNFAFHNFTPGTYTIVAGDEWNQTAITHFRVV